MDAIGVLGTGTMGAGVVRLAAQSGHRIIACDASVGALERAPVSVCEGLWCFAERGAFSEEEAGEAYDRIRWTANAEELGDAGVAIEAIVERVQPKKEALALLDGLLPSDAPIFTNTSSISIMDLASATGRPERVCGTHFFTPPPVREAVERAKALVRSFGKEHVVVEKDVPGFVANRFPMPMIVEACRLLEEGVATKEEIDLLVNKGVGFPIGPFELGDLMGLDVSLDVISYVHGRLDGPSYSPPPILEELVRDGSAE